MQADVEGRIAQIWRDQDGGEGGEGSGDAQDGEGEGSPGGGSGQGESKGKPQKGQGKPSQPQKGQGGTPASPVEQELEEAAQKASETLGGKSQNAKLEAAPEKGEGEDGDGEPEGEEVEEKALATTHELSQPTTDQTVFSRDKLLYPGCYGRLRNGREVGPIRFDKDYGEFPFRADTPETGEESWRPDGTWSVEDSEDHFMDVVAVK
jgi:hypothetical protein